MSIDEALKLGGIIFTALVTVWGVIRGARKYLSVGRNVATLNADMALVQASNAQLRSEILHLQQQNEEKTRGSYERDAKIDTLSEQVRQITNAARLVENTNNNLQGRLAEQRDILGTQLTQQAAQIALLNLDVKNRDARITELEQSKKTIEAASEQDKATIARLEAELNKERDKLESLTTRVVALEREVEVMREERDRLIKERDAAIAERDAALAAKTELERQLAERDETIRQMKAASEAPKPSLK